MNSLEFGLIRSSYVENCMIRDVSTIEKLSMNPKILEEFETIRTL